MAINTFPESVPGLNLIQGLKLMDNRKDSYLRLLLKFKNNQKNVIPQIKKSLEADDTSQAQRAVHALKGIAGNIGADKLYAAMCAIETEIRENNKKEWGRKTDLAQACMTELCTSIELLAAQAITGNKAQKRESIRAVDMDSVWLLIMELKTALEGYYADSIQILESLQNVCAESRLLPELQDIERHLESYDFDKALDFLQKLITRLNAGKE